MTVMQATGRDASGFRALGDYSWNVCEENRGGANRESCRGTDGRKHKPVRGAQVKIRHRPTRFFLFADDAMMCLTWSSLAGCRMKDVPAVLRSNQYCCTFF